MNDYTHPGYRQVVRQMGGGFIRAHYDDREIIEILNATQVYACVAASIGSELANNKALRDHLHTRIKYLRESSARNQ